MPNFSFSAADAKVSESIVYPDPQTVGAIFGLACQDGTANTGFQFVLPNIPSLSGSITGALEWYAAATSGTCVWELAMLAYTLDGAGASIEAAAFDTGVHVDATPDGTTLVGVSNDIVLTTGDQDGAATGDYTLFRVKRLQDDVSDNMSGDGIFVALNLSW